jgi:serine phosphatase RsbU (regulator of sigma subunit)
MQYSSYDKIPKSRIDEERIRTFKSTSLLGLLVTPLINLAWLPFDWFLAPLVFDQFIIIRITLLVFCLGLYALVSKNLLNMEVGTHLSLAPLLCQVLYTMNVVPENAMLTYNLGAAAYYLSLGAALAWRPINSLVFIGYALLLSIVFFLFFGIDTFNIHFRNGGLVVFTAMLIPAITGKMRYDAFLTEITQRYLLDSANIKLANQNEEIIFQNSAIKTQQVELQAAYLRITDSLSYAKKIQESILSPVNELNNKLPNCFIISKPKDIVSGDFFWFRQKAGYTYLAVADCIGHGVPGALMTVLGATLLNQIFEEKHLPTPKDFLENLNIRIRKSHSEGAVDTHEGMDIALIRISPDAKQLLFSGAKRPLLIVRNGELIETKGSKFSIGSCINLLECYDQIEITLQQTDQIYLFTDGITDQIGIKNGKKFMINQLRETLISNSKKPSNYIGEILENNLTQWQGNTPQTDDMMMVGFEIGDCMKVTLNNTVEKVA